MTSGHHFLPNLDVFGNEIIDVVFFPYNRFGLHFEELVALFRGAVDVLDNVLD